MSRTRRTILRGVDIDVGGDDVSGTGFGLCVKHIILEQFQNLLVTPMLAKNVSGISHSVNVLEGNDLVCDGFTRAVKRQSHVAVMPA